MELNDLKQGMVCELRNGTTLTVLGKGNVFNDENYMFYISNNYKDDLTHKRAKQHDIMKVSYGDKVVWERKESTFWLPEKGERYYIVRHFGNVIRHTSENDLIDIGIFKNQLVFKTKEEAEKQLLKQQATIRVIKEIARLNEGWTPNWDDENEPKFYIDFSFVYDELDYNDCLKYKHLDNSLYLKSWELSEQLIETHSKDLKRMLEVE